MGETVKDLNVIELLMGIKEDVSSIKTDMANIKEVQKTEKENTIKALEEAKTEHKKDIALLDEKFSRKLRDLASDVETLKHKDDVEDATKFRRVIAFCLTAIGGMILAKIPDFIAFIINAKK